MDSHQHKQIVLDFYRSVIGNRQIGRLDEFIGDPYIQHSSMVADGKQGLLAALEQLKNMPEPKEQRSPIVWTIAEDGFVALLLDIDMMGNNLVGLDLFRLEHGKIVEHWDVIKPAAMHDFQGIENDNSHKKTDIDTVKKRIQKMFTTKDLDAQYFHDAFMDHDPGAGLGRSTFFETRSKAHKIIGEGQFVLVQSEGKKDERSMVFYDIFRVAEDQIIEHWSLWQGIPDEMPHSNGMI